MQDRPRNSVGPARREQARFVTVARLGKLADDVQVVEYPDRAAVRAGDQVVPLDFDVVNGSHGQVCLERLPPATVVKRNINSELGAGVKQARAFVVLTNHPRVVIPGYPVRYLDPTFAVVRRLQEDGAWIVELVPCAGQVGLSSLVVRRFDRADERPFAQLARCNVPPRCPAVA